MQLDTIWMRYQATIRKYCALRLQPSLTDADADFIAELLERAQSEPTLCLLLDEADHILAHQKDLVDERAIQAQQAKLREAIEREWFDQILQDVAVRSQQCHLAHPLVDEVQEYLRQKGVYNGEIDGIAGHLTIEAARRLQQKGQVDADRREIIERLVSC